MPAPLLVAKNAKAELHLLPGLARAGGGNARVAERAARTLGSLPGKRR
jgi:hypothetical protein